jgi:hypothetical protein
MQSYRYALVFNHIFANFEKKNEVVDLAVKSKASVDI